MNITSLPDLRNKIEEYMNQIRNDGEIPGSKEIILGFRESNPNALKKVSKFLEDIALTKFIADIGTRKTHTFWNSKQEELLFAYSDLPQTIVNRTPNIEGGGATRLIVPKATLGQIEAYLAHKERRLPKLTKKDITLKAVYNIAVLHADSMDTTLEDALKAAAKAKEDSMSA